MEKFTTGQNAECVSVGCSPTNGRSVSHSSPQNAWQPGRVYVCVWGGGNLRAREWGRPERT